MSFTSSNSDNSNVTVRDANLASEDALTFYEKQTTVTGRRVAPKPHRRIQGPYMFEKTTKIVETQVETTLSIPDIMVKPKRAEPIHRPAANDDAFRRLQVIRTFFPNEQRNNATQGASKKKHVRYASTPTRARAGPSRLGRVPDVIIISDDESEEEAKEDRLDVFTQRPVVNDDEDATMEPAAASNGDNNTEDATMEPAAASNGDNNTEAGNTL